MRNVIYIHEGQEKIVDKNYPNATAYIRKIFFDLALGRMRNKMKAVQQGRSLFNVSPSCAPAISSAELHDRTDVFGKNLVL